MNTLPGYVELIESTDHPDDPVTLALAGTIALAPHRSAPYDVALAGLDACALSGLARRHFPYLAGPLPPGDCVAAGERVDEFDDVLALLLACRTVDDDDSYWLAHAIATASMGENHLWQDLGLPDRRTLTRLMDNYFAPLAERNTGNMRWKKFFYRELCRQAEVMLCKSPSCGECSDYVACFGPETALALTSRPRAVSAWRPDLAGPAMVGNV